MYIQVIKTHSAFSIQPGRTYFREQRYTNLDHLNMGVDIATHRKRIGMHCIKLRPITKQGKLHIAPLATYFFGIIIAALLLIAGVEANPGPSEMEQILSALNTLQQEVNSIQHGQNSNFKNLENKINHIASDFTQIHKKQVQIIKTQERHENIFKHYDIKERLNNLVFYGIPESKGERSWDLTYEIRNFLTHMMAINIGEEAINNIYRLGKGTYRPLLVKFNSKATRDFILDNRRKLKNTHFRIEEDFNYDTRQARRNLLPYMQDARSKGHKASLRQNKLLLDGRILDLEYCMANFHLQNHDKPQQRRNRSVSPPTRSQNNSTHQLYTHQRATRSTSLETQPHLRLSSTSPKPHNHPKPAEPLSLLQYDKPSTSHEPNIQMEIQEDHTQRSDSSHFNTSSTSRYEPLHHPRPSPQSERNEAIEAETSASKHQLDQYSIQGKSYYKNKNSDTYSYERINHNYSLRPNVKTLNQAKPSKEL